jgi:serine protease AprX
LALVLLIGAAPHGQQTGAPAAADKLDRALNALVTDRRGQESVRVIIQARDVETRDSLRRRLSAHGDQVEAGYASITAFAATVRVDDLLGLAADPDTERVSVDAIVNAHKALSSLLGTELLPDSGTTGTGVRVAVIDSGLEPTSDIASTRVLGFYDLTRNDSIVPTTAYDDYGHGTHVTGLIAGNGANSNGFYMGIAPGASLLLLKVLDKNGSGYTSDVIQAIDYILANQQTLRINIINLSLGHPIFESAATDPLVLAVQKATRAGIIVVVAAGNYGQDPATGLPAYAGIVSPANAPSAIAAGALDIKDTVGRGDDSVPVYSSRGPTWYDANAKPDLVAPGHQLVSAAALQGTLYQSHPELRVVGNAGDIPRYFRLSGTSMSAAVTSGAVALMLDAAGRNKGYYTPNLVKALLEWSAIPVAGYDALTQGAGSLNVAGALALVRKINPTLPVGSYWLTSSIAPSTTIGGIPWTWVQSVLWGRTLGSGSFIATNQEAWGQTVIWGNTVIWGSTVIWGNDVIWTSPTTWSSTVIWGSDLIGTTDGTTVIWGNTNVTSSTVIWGNLATVAGVGTNSTFADIQQ